jgi:hypothetical protein
LGFCIGAAVGIREFITPLEVVLLLYLGVKEAGSKGFWRVFTGYILVSATVYFIATTVDNFQRASEERSSYRSYY